ncbi:hypothetical protein TrispH2_006939 [Trichoplax sp. H2]|nr:hypothetical protein TrispH2_006939 [Trichoplax sp. H2]|eukprot:RDD41300.1 hypothetical protein TrispH2_006939 [Trichoplax sp. H2]
MIKRSHSQALGDDTDNIQKIFNYGARDISRAKISNGLFEFKLDRDMKLSQMYIQTTKMREFLPLYSDVIVIDGTLKAESTNVALSTYSVIDHFSQSSIVGISLGQNKMTADIIKAIQLFGIAEKGITSMTDDNPIHNKVAKALQQIHVIREPDTLDLSLYKLLQDYVCYPYAVSTIRALVENKRKDCATYTKQYFTGGSIAIQGGDKLPHREELKAESELKIASLYPLITDIIRKIDVQEEKMYSTISQLISEKQFWSPYVEARLDCHPHYERICHRKGLKSAAAEIPDINGIVQLSGKRIEQKERAELTVPSINYIDIDAYYGIPYPTKKVKSYGNNVNGAWSPNTTTAIGDSSDVGNSSLSIHHQDTLIQ